MDHGKSLNLDDLLKDGDKATGLKDFPKVFVLIGKTGSGKSTLSKFMRKDDSLTVIKNEQGLFMFGDGDATIGSTNCLQSKTFFPNTVKDEESGFLFVDCAGFEDTRSCECDLVAAYINKNLFDSAKNIVIALVENYSNLIEGNDRTAFINNLKHVSALIKDNIDSFNKSICLIGTKAQLSHSDEQASKVITTFLKMTERHLHERKGNAELKSDKDELSRLIKIVQFIYDNNHFSWFGQPEEVTSPWEQEHLKVNFVRTRKLVFQDLECATQFKNEFQVAVAEETVNYVIMTVLPNTIEKYIEIIEKFVNLVLKCFDLNMKKEKNIETKCAFVVGYCEEVKKRLADVSKFEDFGNLVDLFQVEKNVWDELQFQNKKLRFLHGIARSDLTKFERDAAGLLGRKDSLLDHVDNILRFYKFLALLLKDDQTCCSELWSSDRDKLSVATFNKFVALLPDRMFDEKTVSAAADLVPTESLVADLNSVLQSCTPAYPDVKTVDKTIFFIGQCILLSSIAPAIKKHNNVMHTIVIAAAKLFYVDCNISLQNTHLVIMAPQVSVLKIQRTLLFTGENGAYLSQQQAEKNTKALNGNAGFSSGSFRMFAKSIKNASLLSIRSVGGDGSDGQNGCDGNDAKTPPAPELSSLKIGGYEDIVRGIEDKGYKVFIQDKGEISRWRHELESHWFSLRSKIKREEIQELKKIEVVNETNSIAPTDGGQGGNAGAGATAGEIEMVMEPIVECISEVRANGKHGKPGLGGEGGATAAKHAHKIYDVKIHRRSVHVSG